MATSWFYIRNNQQVGPVTLEQLQAMIQRGELRQEDKVWSEGMPDWVAASTVPELQTSTATAQVAALSSNAPATTSPLSYQSMGTGSMTASVRAIDMLRQTGPWVRFMSIMMFIGSGLMLLGGLFMIVAGTMVSRVGRGDPSMSLVGIIYIPMAFLYIMPAIFLSRYASNIKKVIVAREINDLEAALEAQKSFWKFMGMMTLIVLCLYTLFIVGAIIFGVAMGLHR